MLVAKDKEKEEEARRAKRLASLVHEESQTDLEPEGRSTPDPRKRPPRARRTLATRNQKRRGQKPQSMRRSGSKSRQRRTLGRRGRTSRRKKTGTVRTTSIRGHSDKTFGGVSYAAILRNLKSRVNPDELRAKRGAIRETRTKDLLVVLDSKAEDRVKLDCLPRCNWSDWICPPPYPHG